MRGLFPQCFHSQMQKLSGIIVRMLYFETKAGLKIAYPMIGIFRKKSKLHEYCVLWIRLLQV